MRRRDFVAGLGSAAVARPANAIAQQVARVRRIGVLTNQNTPNNQDRLDAFRRGMEALGWVEGRNIHVDYRYITNPTEAAELVALAFRGDYSPDFAEYVLAVYGSVPRPGMRRGDRRPESRGACRQRSDRYAP